MIKSIIRGDAESRSGTEIGAMIYGIVSTVWLIIGMQAGDVRSPWLIAPSSIALAVLLIMTAVQLSRKNIDFANQENSEQGKSLGIVFGLQGAVIGVGVGVLAALGQVQWIVPFIATVVGLHFIPVGRIFRLPLDYALAAMILMLVLIATVVMPETAWAAVISLGMMALLWLAGIGRLMQ
ncbi:MAG: hypothetical protein AAGD96_19100 [Chloroflexota bacterium]